MNIVERIDSVMGKLDELMETQELYEAILNAVPFGMFLVDSKFYIEKVNVPLCEYTGYTREELLGQHFNLLLPKDIRTEHAKFEKKFKKNPEARISNHGLRPRVLLKNGDIKYVEINLVPFVFHGNGKILVVMRDYEEMKESLS